MSKKILIIHASAGAGHAKAAEALFLGIKTTPDFAGVLVDALDYTSPFYKQLYRGTYAFLVTKFPWLWGVFFYTADLGWLRKIVSVLRRIMNGLNGRPLSEYLIKENFDCILSTHFFPSEVAAYLKRNGRISARLITVITDFDVHSIWQAEGTDHYAVACEDTAHKLRQLGVVPECITVSGIPINENFAIAADQKEIRKKLQLANDIFTVLLATGSFGIGPIDQIIGALKDVQVVVICGHNKTLHARLIQQDLKFVKVCGLVNNMHELMAAADVMLTKPGGLSISEALVRGLPLIFFNAIPGQETNNIRILKKYDIGFSGCSIQAMAAEVNRLSSNPEEFKRARAHTQRLARPQAVRDIIRLIS